MGQRSITCGTTKASKHPLLQQVAIRLFQVSPQIASVERVCKAEGVIITEETVHMLLYLYVNLRLMNKLTIEMGNLFTDAMRDSNSHEFEEMVDVITCTPNGELDKSLGEIDETLMEKNLVSPLHSHGRICRSISNS